MSSLRITQICSPLPFSLPLLLLLPVFPFHFSPSSPFLLSPFSSLPLFIPPFSHLLLSFIYLLSCPTLSLLSIPSFLPPLSLLMYIACCTHHLGVVSALLTAGEFQLPSPAFTEFWWSIFELFVPLRDKLSNFTHKKSTHVHVRVLICCLCEITR